ncbi:MAG: N-glycosylase/DNA lyase [Candidatus Omnitrophota bacterium]
MSSDTSLRSGLSPLKKAYSINKKAIDKRLREFEHVWRRGEEAVFAELCFCILTPQSKAICCDRAVRRLSEKGLLFSGSRRAVRLALSAVRFPNNKTAYIIAARRLFKKAGVISVRGRIDRHDVPKTREWLVRNVKGIGYKEASHFLRNIGLGRDLAILDVHILRNLVKHRVLRSRPNTIGRKMYLEIEGLMRKFAGKNGIPLDALDLVFWSIGTGYIFK